MTHEANKLGPLKDDRIFDREAHIEILFDGSITLWRSAANLDVVLAYFADFNCLELIVFHPVKNLEAPRLYIDCGILEQHLSLADMQARIKERVDMFTRHHQVVVQENIEKDVKLSTFSNYVVSRIVLKECEGFEVELQARFGDEVVEDTETHLTHLDFVVSPPVNLIPLHTEHLAKPDVGEFLKTLSKFVEERASVESHYVKADRLLFIVELVISAFRGRTLNYANAHCAACRRWKRAINHVLNIIICAKLRKLLQERAYSALHRKVIDENTTVQPSYRKPLGPLNEAEFSQMIKQKKFVNHLPKSKELRKEESFHSVHADIHILKKPGDSQDVSSHRNLLQHQQSLSDSYRILSPRVNMSSLPSSPKSTTPERALSTVLPSIVKQPSVHNSAFSTFASLASYALGHDFKGDANKGSKLEKSQSVPSSQLRAGSTHILPSVNP